MRTASLLGVALTSAIALTPLAAQVPDSFTNLQVLPKNISREQLDRVMDGFTEALGVRCDFCHVRDTTGTPGGRPRMRFAADDKANKKTARVMLQMVHDINAKYLTQLAGGSDITVECLTCHRGNKKPEQLEDVLFAAYLGGGADSVANAYKALRADWYGRDAYDFGERSLIATADMIASTPNRSDNTPAAVATLQLNLSYFPQSIPTLATLARVYVTAGDTADAIGALERAQKIDPNDRRVQFMLGRIRGR